jgi:hypothetical protein
MLRRPSPAIGRPPATADRTQSNPVNGPPARSLSRPSFPPPRSRCFLLCRPLCPMTRHEAIAATSSTGCARREYGRLYDRRSGAGPSRPTARHRGGRVDVAAGGARRPHERNAPRRARGSDLCRRRGAGPAYALSPARGDRRMDSPPRRVGADPSRDRPPGRSLRRLTRRERRRRRGRGACGRGELRRPLDVGGAPLFRQRCPDPRSGRSGAQTVGRDRRSRLARTFRSGAAR